MALVKYEESPEVFQELLRSIEYEVQFFKVASCSIYFNLKNYVLRQIRHNLLNMKNSLIKRSRTGEENECNEIIKRLKVKYEFAVEKCFKEYENKFLSVFKIPSFVLLPDDKIHSMQCSENDIEEIDEEIERLKLRYKRAICLEAVLKEEKRQYSKLDMITLKMMNLEDQINNYSNLFSSTQLKWNTTFSTLNDLNSLYEQIRTIAV